MAPWLSDSPAPTAAHDPGQAPGMMDGDDKRDPAGNRVGRVSTPASLLALSRPRESFLRIAGVTGRRLPAGRHVAHVHPQTVPVRWVNGDGEPEPVVLFVEPNSIDLEDRYPPVGGELEEPHLGLIGRPHRDRVAVTGLLDPALLGKVGDGAARDVLCLDQVVRTL